MALAREMGARPISIEDGDILNLSPGTVEVVDSAPVDKLVADGARLVPIGGAVMTARRKMVFNGVVVGSFAVDGAGDVVGRPRVSAPGLFDADDPENDRVANDFARELDDLSNVVRRDDALLAEAARGALRRALGRRLQKRPMVDVHLLRV
jgi:ribonuclease J